jgi:hypothetical protein
MFSKPSEERRSYVLSLFEPIEKSLASMWSHFNAGIEHFSGKSSSYRNAVGPWLNKVADTLASLTLPVTRILRQAQSATTDMFESAADAATRVVRSHT